MYYDTIEQAIEAAPDCTHVLTTGPDWGRHPEQNTDVAGCFVAAVKQSKVFSPLNEYGKTTVDISAHIAPSHWQIALDRTKCPDPRITAARFDQAASESARATASGRQVGGDHYKSLKIQPIEYIDANNLPYLEGNVIKYVTRHASKNGVQDIDKAIHYLELIKQFRYGGNDVTPEEKATMSFSEAGRKYLAALRGENVK